MAKCMTVGDLKREIAGLDDDMEVIVESSVNDGDDHYVLPLESVSVEHRCADEPALFLFGSDEDDGDFDDYREDAEKDEDDDGDEDESE